MGSDCGCQAIVYEEDRGISKAGIERWALFVVLTIVALLVALVPLDAGMYRALTTRILDAGHFFAFGVFAIAAYAGMLGRGLRHRVSAVVMLSLGLALALEALQSLSGRSAAIGDVVMDMLGVAVFLAVFVPRRRPAWRRLAVAVFIVMCFVVVSWPAMEGYRIWAGRHASPILGSFETAKDRLMWRPSSPGDWPTARTELDKNWVSEGRSALSVRTQSGAWSGVNYYGYGADWSGYQALHFDIYNPGTPFSLGIRIDDTVIKNPTYGQRYNTMLQIRHGWNSVTLTMAQVAAGPAKRRLDLTRIFRLMMFVEPKQPPRHFYLDNVRLE